MEPETPANKSPSETDLIRKWVDAWRAAGPESEKFKRQELRKLTDEQAALSR